MKEIDKYILYIQYQRAKNDEGIAALLEDGFELSREKLIALANEVKEVHEQLYNRTITVYLDVGAICGHVYMEGPIYDVESRTIKTQIYGKYPNLSALGGGGIVDDTERVNYRSISVQLPVTEEAWQYLGFFVQKEQAKLQIVNDYDLLARNCAHFVDSALKAIGIVDGLVDKFNFSDLKELPWKPIKPFALNYFRVSKAADFLYFTEPYVASSGVISTGYSPDIYQYILQLSSYLPQYEEEKRQANAQTHVNFIDGFIDGEDFYARYNNTLLSQSTSVPTFAKPELQAKEASPVVEPKPLTPMEQSALEGCKFAAELKAPQAMLFGFPASVMPTEEEMQRQAQELIAYSNAALEEASKLGAKFQQQQKHWFS
jgi:hypothetical protein